MKWSLRCCGSCKSSNSLSLLYGVHIHIINLVMGSVCLVYLFQTLRALCSVQVLKIILLETENDNFIGCFRKLNRFMPSCLD